jgi:uncharacterized membrane protein YhhN
MWPTLLLALIAASAAAAIYGAVRGRRRLHYAAKPLATALVLLLAVLAPAPVSGVYRGLVALGLALSLAGDVFLMLPRDRFVAGLASFLAAHLCYIAAFASQSQPPSYFVPIVVLAAYGAVLLRLLWRHLGRLKAPVLAYALVLLGMAWMAAEQWNEAASPRAFLALAGAVLFVVSDSALALDRFRRRIPGAQAIILATYWAAQALIALSVSRLFE